MNDIPEDIILPPADERISEIRDGIFQDVIDNHAAEKAFNHKIKLQDRLFGKFGMSVGVLGIVAATAMAIYERPVAVYRDIDNSEGVIHPSYGAKDAPDHFSDRVINHYLAEFISLRERFVWQMDSEIDQRVKLMSSPDEQKRYQADRDSGNPLEKYGMNGYSRITWFDPNGFKIRAKGKDKTMEYDVQFVKSELLAGANQITSAHMTARIIFQMHPELLESDQDRLDNEAGMYVVSYNSSKD
jgi:type IV secretory pathway component VirB8